MKMLYFVERYKRGQL